MSLPGKRQLYSPYWTIVLGVVYGLVAYGALQFSFKGTNASPIWPPSGIAFTAVCFFGYRVWPGILLGAFGANLLVCLHHGWAPVLAVSVSALTAIGNSAEALAGLFLLRSFTDQTVLLSKIDEIFKYIFAVMVACTASATIGTSAVYFFHPPFQGVSFDTAWFTWWLGDTVGILMIASPFLTFHKKEWRINFRKNGLEAFVVFLVLAGINYGVFMGTFPEYGFYSHVTYLVLPFAIWATYRFGFPGAIVSILTTSVIADIGSIYHLGPFVGERLAVDLLIIQCFIGVVAVTVLSLAAASYERQKAEEDIKHNEARFRSVVENSFDGITMTDVEAKILYSSPAIRRNLGFEPRELLGKSFLSLMHPEDLPVVIEKFQKMVKIPGNRAYAIARARRKDGSYVWLEGTGHNLLHEPAVGAVVINYRNISEQKYYQERFEKVVEFSPVANIMANRDGDIVLVNQATEKLLGYTHEELLHMKLESLIPEQYRSHHLGFREGFYKAPEARPMGLGRDLYALAKDGRHVPVEIALTPIETEHGMQVLASVVDITNRKKAETILKRDNESLERMVDERSKELIKTQKELKQFSRLADIGTLAATVAHELRNPLGVIHLAAYNLRKEKSDLGANKHLANIEKKVWEGNQIIDNLLSYARIKIPNYEQVHLFQILDECVTSVQSRFAEKGIVLEKEYTNDPDVIEADGTQIREIFVNILNNACQSFIGPAGKVAIDARREGDAFKISVKDTGAGIAQEDMDKIFEPFFTRKSKGTGLGLTICNELVNMHQGRIEINSRLGQGTTVDIFLPAHRNNYAETSPDR
ncbi:MAG: PAS domain S-box protein [Candidatus Omnitrophica bacterium]|nr:PAS domain S-box protein [Candidatus Omnitrophota bacterium]